MLVKTYSATIQGIDGRVIEVEAGVQNALPAIHITGLPGKVVKESRDRIQACLSGLGYDIPSGRIVVHLSPADAPKIGSQFDLAIAMSILAVEKLLPVDKISSYGFLGELTLDGRVQRVGSALSLVEALEKNTKIQKIFMPEENAHEASLVSSGKVFPVKSLTEVIEYLFERCPLTALEKNPISLPKDLNYPSLDQVIGQNLAKRALEIALAGGHHLLLAGPPGVGKSLIASCAPGLLPNLEDIESGMLAKIANFSVRKKKWNGLRPFRSPHHSISAAALLGGGTGIVNPGEVTLAHGGILFLDEFPEFRRDALEGLREPLQSGEIHIHRTSEALTLPARFILIAAMNPCPCGYSLGGNRLCRCSPERVWNYRKRLSGPILDRMDLMVTLHSPTGEEKKIPELSHQEIKIAIQRACELQKKRYGEPQMIKNNAQVLPSSFPDAFYLGKDEKDWFTKNTLQNPVSFRTLHKILKLARTIADLENSPNIQLNHLNEAWGFRCGDFFQAL